MPTQSRLLIVNQLVTGHFYEGSNYGTWRPRGTHDDLLIYTVAGAGRFGFSNGFHITQPGELTLLRVGTPHDYATDQTVGHWELLWTHFRPRSHWLDWFGLPQMALGLHSLQTEPPQSQRIESALLEMHNFATGDLIDRESWAMNALERVWIETLQLIEPSPRDARITRAIGFLRARLGEPLDLNQLAQHCHFSVSRLGHLFKEQTGQSPSAFLETERMRRAAQLLTLTSISVSSIALDVGYADPLYFSKRFHARMGSSPRQYRLKTLDTRALPAVEGESLIK